MKDLIRKILKEEDDLGWVSDIVSQPIGLSIEIQRIGGDGRMEYWPNDLPVIIKWKEVLTEFNEENPNSAIYLIDGTTSPDYLLTFHLINDDRVVVFGRPIRVAKYFKKDETSPTKIFPWGPENDGVLDLLFYVLEII